jgi:hypothetical protein
MAKAVFNEWPPSRMGQAGADLIALGEKASLEFDANGLRRYVRKEDSHASFAGEIRDRDREAREPAPKSAPAPSKA